MINLDQNATTRVAPQVVHAMTRAMEALPGNPSSVHEPGRLARAALEEARMELANVLDVAPEAVVFVASGSEANNLAIKGLVLARVGKPSHLVVSAIEHLSVLHAARAMAKLCPWVSLTEVSPDADGRVQPQALAAAFRPETCLVCLMHANNETGVLQPVAEAARLAHEVGAAFHCDAIQSLGRASLDVAALDCDTLALSAHKFHGPKGVGALIVRPGMELVPLVHGGNQERQLRAGTENVPAAIGMALAARLAVERLDANVERLRLLERAFCAVLRAGLPDLQFNGDQVDKLPGVVNASIPGVHRDDLVVGLEMAGFAVSGGSACASGVLEPSHVLTAMGLSPWRARGGTRVSFGAEHSEQDARGAAEALTMLARRLQAVSPVEDAQ
jgi:cysteine desulfurase